MLSFVLAAPRDTISNEAAARAIQKETGLKAYTEQEFAWATMHWYFINTGIPISFGTTIVLGFIVGIAIVGQTFYTFVLDHLKHLGALKAMGASNGMLARMVLLQALTVGLIGYGCGMGLASLFGYAVLEKTQPPFFMPYELPLLTFGVVIFICCVSALIGILKIFKIEPAMVFRG
jgi:putative ABC transport system permease protein